MSIVPIVDRLMAETRPPRDYLSLLDLGIQAGLRADHLGLDAGSFDGKWAKWLNERYGCRMVALDLAQSALREAMAKGLLAVGGDVHALPIQSASFNFIWCRDTLECVGDPDATLREFHRVLKPGGQVLLYVAFTTPLLEPLECAQLMKALDQPAWWDKGIAPVEDAIDAAGFEIVIKDFISPEFSERALLDRNIESIDEMALLARLRRERARFEAEMGTAWYERWVAWMQWNLYLLLGKLQTVAWVLHKPV